MIKVLRVVLIIYGVILLLMGLGGIILPEQTSGLFGLDEITNNIIYLAMVISAFSITIGIWLIVIGRNPLANIYWVKFAITKTLIFVVIELYLIIRGYVEFNQIAAGIILDTVFAALFLVFYPWRIAQVSE
jgi:hypothetical protein